MLDYYRVSARSISALDLSQVFNRFINFAIGQPASQSHQLSRSERSLLQVFKEFLLWNHFQGKEMSTEITKPAL
jgi:hypothetical protein